MSSQQLLVLFTDVIWPKKPKKRKKGEPTLHVSKEERPVPVLQALRFTPPVDTGPAQQDPLCALAEQVAQRFKLPHEQRDLLITWLHNNQHGGAVQRVLLLRDHYGNETISVLPVVAADVSRIAEETVTTTSKVVKPAAAEIWNGGTKKPTENAPWVREPVRTHDH